LLNIPKVLGRVKVVVVIVVVVVVASKRLSLVLGRRRGRMINITA